MKTLLIIISCLIPFLLFGQTDNKGTFKVRKINNTEVITFVEEMPTFPGGENALMQFLSDNIQYPDSAKANSITGTVFVSFIIDAEGNVTNAKVLRGVNKLLDDEALRVVRMLPKWIPGKQGGINVAVYYHFPVKFILK